MQVSPPAVEIADGDAAHARYQYPSAITHYTRAIGSDRISPAEFVAAKIKRATAYVDQFLMDGGTDYGLVAALHDFSDVRALVPNHPQAVFGEASAYLNLGAYPEAFAELREAYALDQPMPYWSLVTIGAAYRSMGDYRNAMRYYDRALEVAGPNGGMPIFYHRAMTLFAMGRFRDAVDALNVGIPQQRDYSWAYIYRACSYARLGEYERARADYGAAIEFWRRLGGELGHLASWRENLARMTRERDAVADLARGAAPALEATSLCQEYLGERHNRERSRLLPPATNTGPIPDLNILPDRQRPGSA